MRRSVFIRKAPPWIIFSSLIAILFHLCDTHTVVKRETNKYNSETFQFSTIRSPPFVFRENTSLINVTIKRNVSTQVFILENPPGGLGDVKTIKVMKNLERISRLGNVRIGESNQSVVPLFSPQSRQLRNVRGRGKSKFGENTALSNVPMSSDGRKILTILGLFELSYVNNTAKRSGGNAEKIAAEMALEDVNKNDQILPGYQLVMHTNDTQCDPGTGVDAFYHALYTRRNTSVKIIALLGTACSEVTERLAKVATFHGIAQVSFGSTSPSLSDRKEFPLFYRTVAPVSSHSQAIIELIAKFKWDTVSFFTENENRFTMPVNQLVKEMEEKANITTKVTLTFSLADFRDQLDDLNQSDSRIIIASFGVEVAPYVFCEVYKREMFGPDFAWIWLGKPETLWWKSESLIITPTKSSRLRSSTSWNQSHVNYDDITHKNNNYSRHGESGDADGLQMKRVKATNGTSETRVKHERGILECSQKQLSQAVEYVLVVDRFNSLEAGRMSEFGLTTESFGARLREKLKMKEKPSSSSKSLVPVLESLKKKYSITDSSTSPLEEDGVGLMGESQFAPEAYDAVWTLALGLDKLRQKHNYSLEYFTYMDKNFSHLLNEEIGKLTFKGISGPISFLGADRLGVTSILQVQEGVLRPIGLFHPDRIVENQLELWNCSGNLTIQNFPCYSIRWPNGQIPIARRVFRLKLVQVDNKLFAIVAAAAFFGIVMAITFLAFNLYFRKMKYIKLSSPKLNNMCIIGCIFAYMAVIILGSDFGPTQQSNELRFSYICTIRAYLLSTAFSLAFGAMFAKTYRVHRIFTRSCIGVVKNKLLKDTQLMTLVMVLFLIDVSLVTSWAIFDPMHRSIQNLTMHIDETNRSVVYQPQIEVCHSKHSSWWMGAMYAYKSLLLVVGIYMAWETRHVKIQVLNDSKNIAYCVYIVVLTSVLAVSLANIISDRVTMAFISVTSLILLATTVTLCLLFLPKIHAIKTGGYKKDPVVESMGLKIEFNTRRLVVEDPKELMFRAEVQNRVFKRQIEAIDLEIWRLENLLMCSNHSSIASTDKKAGKEPRHSRDSATTGNQEEDAESSDETSEIYTVYLHGPKFMVPISFFNFQNPRATLDLGYSQSQCQPANVQPTSSILQLPTQTPRSSWPNIRALLTPPNGLFPKIQFKSEPKLGLEDPSEKTEGHGMEGKTNLINPSPRVTFGESDESFNTFMGGSKSSLSRASFAIGGGGGNNKGSRKNSSASTGRRSSFLSLLRQPFVYLSEKVRNKSGDSESPRKFKGKAYEASSGENGEEEPQVFHLHVPRDSIRQKFNSAPDLWAVRTSPTMQHNYQKKSSIMSDSVVGSSFLGLVSSTSKKSSSNPVLQLTETSDESPFL